MKNSVLYGDCLLVLRELPSGCVDLVINDLPYGKTAADFDVPIDLVSMWKQLLRVAKTNAAFLFTAQQPFSSDLVTSNRKLYRYNWIWEKTMATGFLNAKRMPLVAHEEVLVFYRKLPKYNPQKTKGHIRKTTKRKGQSSENYNRNKVCVSTYDSTERYPRSVLRFAHDKQKNNLHPQQKPVKLIEYMIRTYSDRGELVLDICAGSGTTGEACMNAERDFLLIENDAHFFEVCIERTKGDRK